MGPVQLQRQRAAPEGIVTTPAPPLDLPLLTAEQVATEILQIPPATVLMMAREDRLPSMMIGKHRRFSRSAVVEAVRRSIERDRPL